MMTSWGAHRMAGFGCAPVYTNPNRLDSRFVDRVPYPVVYNARSMKSGGSRLHTSLETRLSRRPVTQTPRRVQSCDRVSGRVNNRPQTRCLVRDIVRLLRLYLDPDGRNGEDEGENGMAGTTCTICLDDVKSPVSIPCGHLHCEACLVQYVEQHEEVAEAPCPTCRALFCVGKLHIKWLIAHLRP